VSRWWQEFHTDGVWVCVCEALTSTNRSMELITEGTALRHTDLRVELDEYITAQTPSWAQHTDTGTSQRFYFKIIRITTQTEPFVDKDVEIKQNVICSASFEVNHYGFRAFMNHLFLSVKYSLSIMSSGD